MKNISSHCLFINFPSCSGLLQDAYNSMQVGDKVTHLLLALQTKTLSEQARQMAAVVLRRLFSTHFQEFYPNVSILFPVHQHR